MSTLHEHFGKKSPLADATAEMVRQGRACPECGTSRLPGAALPCRNEWHANEEPS